MGEIDNSLQGTFKTGAAYLVEEQGDYYSHNHSQKEIHHAYLYSISEDAPEPAGTKKPCKIIKTDKARPGKDIVPVKRKPYPQHGQVVKQKNKNKSGKKHQIQIGAFF
jgi:cell division septation protein DedD